MSLLRLLTNIFTLLILRQEIVSKPNKHVGLAPTAEDLYILPDKEFVHVEKFASAKKYVSSKINVEASSFTCVKLVKKYGDVTM